MRLPKSAPNPVEFPPATPRLHGTTGTPHAHSARYWPEPTSRSGPPWPPAAPSAAPRLKYRYADPPPTPAAAQPPKHTRTTYLMGGAEPAQPAALHPWAAPRPCAAPESIEAPARVRFA